MKNNNTDMTFDEMREKLFNEMDLYCAKNNISKNTLINQIQKAERKQNKKNIKVNTK